MNLRIKSKLLKRKNESLNKQLKILDTAISASMKYQMDLECRVAAQNILILEMDKNNDTLHKSLNYKIKDSMDQSFMIEELKSENRRLSKVLESKNKGFFKRIFA